VQVLQDVDASLEFAARLFRSSKTNWHTLLYGTHCGVHFCCHRVQVLQGVDASLVSAARLIRNSNTYWHILVCRKHGGVHFCCHRVQVLQGVDASLVFADGSTLLHEAVDLAIGDAHVQVLLDAVLASMGPADLMVQNPADRQFLNRMHEGKTALFKVG
jgi:hypothetical protein